MEATPFTIAMVNMKGGVAKTGTVHQLSGAFAKMGLKVLLVDMDPQASLTKGFFGPEATEALPERDTVLALFDDAFDPDPDICADERTDISSCNSGCDPRPL